MKKHLDHDTLAFVKELKEKNNREWFEQNRPRYELARKDFLAYLDSLLKGMVEFEPVAEGQKAKDTLFRIYRDVRFSPNKNPYKDHFGAYIAKGGKKSNYPGYYLHLSPANGSFLAGGVWFLPPEELKAARQEIDYNHDELDLILQNLEFRNYFSGLSGEKLSRPPKGYEKDNPAIDLLKMKQWTASCPLQDDDLTTDRGYGLILQAMRALKPLNDFFTRPLDDLRQ